MLFYDFSKTYKSCIFMSLYLHLITNVKKKS